MPSFRLSRFTGMLDNCFAIINSLPFEGAYYLVTRIHSINRGINLKCFSNKGAAIYRPRFWIVADHSCVFNVFRCLAIQPYTNHALLTAITHLGSTYLVVSFNAQVYSA